MVDALVWTAQNSDIDHEIGGAYPICQIWWMRQLVNLFICHWSIPQKTNRFKSPEYALAFEIIIEARNNIWGSTRLTDLLSHLKWIYYEQLPPGGGLYPLYTILKGTEQEQYYFKTTNQFDPTKSSSPPREIYTYTISRSSLVLPGSSSSEIWPRFFEEDAKFRNHAQEGWKELTWGKGYFFQLYTRKENSRPWHTRNTLFGFNKTFFSLNRFLGCIRGILICIWLNPSDYIQSIFFFFRKTIFNTQIFIVIFIIIFFLY